MVDEEDDNLDSFRQILGLLTYSRDFKVCTIVCKSKYEGDMLQIGKYLSTHEKEETWFKKLFGKIRKKDYKLFLRDGYLWKHPKIVLGTPQRVIGHPDEQLKLISEFHDSIWVGHRGVWKTYSKLKDKCWWLGIYKDIASYFETCEHYKMYSNIQYHDDLKPTYSLTTFYVK